MSPVRAARPASHLRIVSEAEVVGAGDRSAAWLRDRDRLLAIAAGDRLTAAALYDEHLPRVHAAIVRMLGSAGDDQADLVQRVFVELVRSAASFRGDCSLATWTSRIAANVSLNALRARRRRRALFTTEEAPDAVAPRGPDPDAGRLVRAALAQISAEKAEVVLLHDLLGHDLAEIAVLAGASPAAVQSRLVRGRKELRALIERARGEHP